MIREDRLVDIIWSPIKEDEFAAYDNDLYLFKVKNFNSQNTSNNTLIKLCDESNAELLANYAENSNPRLVAWSLSHENPYLFAINLPNHKIQLISFNQIKKKNSNGANKNFEILKEFSFRQTRQCNNMVWNSYKTNYLAVGFERIRNEHSILVWDVRSNSNTPTNRSEQTAETIIYSTTPSAPITNRTQPYSSLASITTSINTGASSQIIYSVLNAGTIDPKKSEQIEPVYEMGTSETTNSLSWNPHSEHSLLAGMNGKSLKIYDIRVTMKACQSINTRYVNSFSIDHAPNSSQYQAASFSGNTVALWDTRKFDKPVDTINEGDSILKISWCPTKCGRLAVSSHNSSAINIYSIKSVNNSLTASVIEDVNAPKQLIIDKTSKRSVPLSTSPTASHTNGQLINNASPEKISNFCWYRFDSNKILYASNFLLNNLKTLCLSDTIVLTWSPNDDLCWSSSSGKLNLIENFDRDEFDFVNELKARTEADYGLIYEIVTISNGNATSIASTYSSYNQYSAANMNNISVIPLGLALHASHGISTLIRSDFIHNFKNCQFKANTELYSNVKCLWQWFDTINRLFEITIPLNPRNTQIELPANSRNTLIELYWTRYCGLRTLLDDFISKRPTALELQQNHDDRFRIIAFNLCGWDFKDGSVSTQFFSNLEKRNQFERAACLAVLTNSYEQALDILEAASKIDNRFGCLWIALKYFNSDSSMNMPSEAIIKECNRLIENFNNPYLKALFNYVLNKEESIFDILYDRSILFQDRIALSICFMYNAKKQTQLAEYFDYLIEEECLKNADLNGVLLTGLNLKSIDLFQEFIDKTGDIQTIALAIIHTPYVEVLQSKQVENWIQSYRELLNKFKLWEKRAEFDVLKMKLTKSKHNLNMSHFQSENNMMLYNETSPVNSAFISNAITKHQSYPNSNQFNTNGHNQQANYFRQVYNPPGNNQAMNRYTVGQPNGANSQSNSNNINLHLACNNCGKILLDKAPVGLIENNRNAVFASIHRGRSNTINSGNVVNFGNSNGHLGAQQQHSTHYYQPNVQCLLKPFYINGLKLNDSCINGCLHCAKYLPQCIVCLKYMKINLTPTPTVINNSLNATNHLIIPLNRSQSLYAPSAKMSLPMNSNNSASKIAFELKANALISPPMSLINNPQFHNAALLISNSLSSNFNNPEQETNVESEEIKPSHAAVQTKPGLSNENIFFLKENKFGKWFAWCQSCKHGGHIAHLIEWFKTHDKCPFLHCKCQCLNLDHVHNI